MSILVSVLIPTKNRVDLLRRSMASLFDLSDDPGNIEVIVAHDDTDLPSIEYFSSSKWSTDCSAWGGSCRALPCPAWGYWELNRYYNIMAQQAQGQWFVIWNDDAVMLTQGWDQHIKKQNNFVGMLHMTTQNFKPNLTLFPIIPRVWNDLFGEISHTQITDTWIQNICHEAGAVLEIPVTVLHDRYDVTGNNLDQTYLDRRYNKKAFNHESMQLLRSQWAQRLKDYREQTNASVAMPHQT